MSITGPADGEPHKVGVAVVDVTAGLFAANAILTALHHREKTGVGQYIDVALLDSEIGWLANVAQNFLASGETPGRYSNAHPNIVPYETFETADGSLAQLLVPMPNTGVSAKLSSDQIYGMIHDTGPIQDVWQHAKNLYRC